jgi:hypothetical protein
LVNAVADSPEGRPLIFASGAILYGALRIKQLESRRLAIASAILALAATHR